MQDPEQKNSTWKNEQCTLKKAIETGIIKKPLGRAQKYDV